MSRSSPTDDYNTWRNSIGGPNTRWRRSELCRSRDIDYDFEAATILIREKK